MTSTIRTHVRDRHPQIKKIPRNTADVARAHAEAHHRYHSDHLHENDQKGTPAGPNTTQRRPSGWTTGLGVIDKKNPLSLIVAGPAGWTIEFARLSHVPESTGPRIDDIPREPGDYLIVRRNGRTVGWAATMEEVAATGCPTGNELIETDRAYPPRTYDPWLANRRYRKRVGGY